MIVPATLIGLLVLFVALLGGASSQDPTCTAQPVAVFDDDLYIYYGAADERVAVASVKLPTLLDHLKMNSK